MNFNGCQLHEKQQYKFICLSSHKCIRRLCIECWDEHQLHYPGFKYQTIQIFIQKLKTAYSILNEENYWNHCYQNLLSLIIKAENVQQTQKQSIIQYLKFLSKDIEEIDSEYYHLKRKLETKMIEIFTFSELQSLIVQESDQEAQIIKANNFKKKSVLLLNQSVKYFITQAQQISDPNLNIYQNYPSFAQQNVFQLIGEQYFGMKHGKYYYQLENSEVKYAGKYLFNERVGYWKVLQDGFEFCGQYLHGNKMGQWKFFWKGLLISNCEYNNDGQKQGYWQKVVMRKYIKKNVNEKVFLNEMIILKGNYNKGLKVGFWKISYFNLKHSDLLDIGGGEYNQNGIKTGIWIDIDENEYSNQKKIFWKGKYEEGLKVGGWQIYLQSGKKDYLIGGGQYDSQGRKIGFWKEINEKEFQQNQQILYQGYYQEGIRIGEWKISYSYNPGLGYSCIGGGQYDHLGQTTGMWKEINQQSFFGDEYNKFLGVFWQGKYLGGLKVGQWKTFYRQRELSPFSLIGEGYFDDKGRKDGFWKDIEFGNIGLPIIVLGQYHKGVRVSEWVQLIRQNSFLFNSLQTYQIFGKGHYNHNGIKTGFWKEIIDYSDDQIITYLEGMYQEGLKVGEWKFFCVSNQFEEFYTNNGGHYDDNGLKTGIWEDEIKKITLQYSKGIKIGEWKQFTIDWDFPKQKQQSIVYREGGCYDQYGLKTGMWKFKKSSNAIWQGNYLQGLKVGEWKLYYKYSILDFIIIGGGQYDQNGIKQGFWKDFDQQFFYQGPIILWEGQYLSGFRIGKWRMLKIEEMGNFKIIGEGFYDQQGQKQGNWVEYNDDGNDPQLLFNGCYENGLKVGKWVAYVKMRNEEDVFQLGGYYDQKGQKTDYWIELQKIQDKLNLMLLKQGKYSEGTKVEKWNENEFNSFTMKEQLARKPQRFNLIEKNKLKGLLQMIICI